MKYQMTPRTFEYTAIEKVQNQEQRFGYWYSLDSF